MKNLSLLLLLGCLMSSCQSYTPDTTEMRQMLFQKWMKDKSFNALLEAHPNTYILQDEYFIRHDCQKYLQDAGLELPIFTKEEAFMRNMKNQIVIQEVNLSVAKPYLIYKLVSRNQPAEIKKIEL